MQFKDFKRKFLRILGELLLVPLINVLCKTVHVKEINKPEKEINSNFKNYVFAFWHGSMLIPWFKLREFNPSTIISQSKDGSLLVKILKGWNYDVKRGSSSRDGKIVLEELIKNAAQKRSIAITPDGPRGPYREMKAGAVIISKKSEIPLILVGVYYKRKTMLKSWDKFEIPWFFSKAVICYSDPIMIDQNLTYEETDTKIHEIGHKLNDLHLKAEKEF